MDEMSAPGFRTPTRNVAGLAAARFVPGMRDRMIEVAAAITKDGVQGEIPREAIAGLAMPVSVAWGSADPVLPFAQSAGLPVAFALHAIPGAGHMLPVEARRAVTAIIRRTAS
jgi:pyruvate dehydrogenase E2 component (dihydrolipoamide acetyltransferase)